MIEIFDLRIHLFDEIEVFIEYQVIRQSVDLPKNLGQMLPLPDDINILRRGLHGKCFPLCRQTGDGDLLSGTDMVQVFHPRIELPEFLVEIGHILFIGLEIPQEDLPEGIPLLHGIAMRFERFQAFRMLDHGNIFCKPAHRKDKQESHKDCASFPHQ